MGLTRVETLIRGNRATHALVVHQLKTESETDRPKALPIPLKPHLDRAACGRHGGIGRRNGRETRQSRTILQKRMESEGG